MTGTESTADNRDHVLQAFAADLTAAVYPIALQYGAGHLWVDLELDLRRAVVETVKKRDRTSAQDKGQH
jgi:hypothetical protein